MKEKKRSVSDHTALLWVNYGLSEASVSTMVKWGESCGIAQLGAKRLPL